MGDAVVAIPSAAVASAAVASAVSTRGVAGTCCGGGGFLKSTALHCSQVQHLRASGTIVLFRSSCWRRYVDKNLSPLSVVGLFDQDLKPDLT